MINRKSKKSLTRIMLFGTFDYIHKGHLHFLKQARKLAPQSFVIVSIARDINVKLIKGRKPTFTEVQRARAVKQTGLVDEVVLGGLRSFLPHIAKEKPNIIALGYDQSNYTEQLEEKLEKRGLKVKIVRLNPHKPHVYKSSLLKRKHLKNMV